VSIAEAHAGIDRLGLARQVLDDFARRLAASRWSQPQLNEPIELFEYMPAVAWALLVDAAVAGRESWWKRTLAQYTPARAGRWGADDSNRCALILFAASEGARMAAHDRGQGGSLGLDVFADAEPLLREWLWGHHPPHGAIRMLPLKLVETELTLGNGASASRIVRVAREIRDGGTLDRVMTAVKASPLANDPIWSEIVHLRDERVEYERRLAGLAAHSMESNAKSIPDGSTDGD
jgi:hypothetical protein